MMKMTIKIVLLVETITIVAGGTRSRITVAKQAAVVLNVPTKIASTMMLTRNWNKQQ
jgi:hypothetical protein